MSKQDTTAVAATFGIEIECLVPRTSGITAQGWSGNGRNMGRMTAQQGGRTPEGQFVAAPIRESGNRKGFVCTSDSSLDGQYGYEAVEFVSDIMQGEGDVAYLISFLEWLRSMGAKINRSCGVHVHVGIESLGLTTVDDTCSFIEKLTGLVAHHELGIYGQTGTNRHQSRWCKRIDEQYKNQVKTAKKSKRIYDLPRDRYFLLNLTNVSGRGTVEFRAFAGTLNTNKILGHLGTCLGLASAANMNSRVSWTNSKAQTAQDAVKHLWQYLGWVSGKGAPSGTYTMRKKQGRHFAYGLFGASLERKKEILNTGMKMATKFDDRFVVRSQFAG